MDMKKLLETVTKFAGEPEQKPGDQVRGTEKPPKGKDHAFKGRLVGAAESKGSTLKDLDKLAESKSLEWQLMEEFESFTEEKEKFGTGEKRKGRKSRERAKDDKVLESKELITGFNEWQQAASALTAGFVDFKYNKNNTLLAAIDTESNSIIGVWDEHEGEGTVGEDYNLKVNDFKTVITERTVDEEWQGWVIRYETSPVAAGKPVRWMVYHKKRGPEDAHFGEASDAKTAVDLAKEWIQTGGNAKEITTNQNITIDFNARFVNEILNGGRDFFAKIIAGPTLIVQDTPAPGFKRSSIRTQKDKITEKTTLVPAIVISGKEAAAAGLKAHGRYILGDTTRAKDGSMSFPLIYQSTVQSKSDKLHLSKPALTVAMKRDATGESIVRESAIGDGDIANAVMSQVMELIGEGHTEVSPDVITTKVSAAIGQPFMLKDLVAANNASPELQHYISSINPSKVKFSTDILTVKNEDPMKAKEQAQAGIEKMAARAAGRDRSLAENHNRFDEPLTGWHIVNRETGSKVFNTPSFETKEAAQKYKMEKMWDNHHLYAVAHTKELQESSKHDEWIPVSDIVSKSGKLLGMVIQHNKLGSYGYYDERKHRIESGFSTPEEARQAFIDLHRSRLGDQRPKVAEGWESGPEERGRSMRDLADDPDWAYDQARQEKIDRAAEKQHGVTKYYVYDGIQKKRVSKDFGSQDEAVAARAQIQKNKPHLSIQSYKANPALTEAPIEMDPEDPMDPLVHGAGANPAKLSYRMLRAQSQLADLAARAKNATPYEWQQIARNFDELTMNINQIKHALAELAKTRAKGGTRSRGIDPEIDTLSEDEWRNPKYDYFDYELAEWKQQIKELYPDAKFYVASEAEGGTREAYSGGDFIGDWDGSGSPSCRIKKVAVTEMGSAVGGGAAGQSVTNNPQQAAKVAQASSTLKAATGSVAPAPKLTQAIDRASQGQQVSAQDMQALEPVMDVVKKTAEDPKLANQFKTLAQQARRNL